MSSFPRGNTMRFGLVVVSGALLLVSCAHQKKTMVFPERFEGLTQLVLATETKNLTFTDTTVQKILGFKVGSAQIRVTANVTFDFYLDFDKDEYAMSYDEATQVLTFRAPPLRVKKPVINGAQVSYPEKSILINEEQKAIGKLETLTGEFIDEGEELVRQGYVIDKCNEMLKSYLSDLCKKLGYQVKDIKIIYQVPQAFMATSPEITLPA